ncbi:DUF2534 family protein [Cronobacter turicensis]|nr:DUF2534 family protein [Cronobacter turicensis]ELQ6272555.1 DUF2534 family protein [Cronobacter turicensis]
MLEKLRTPDGKKFLTALVIVFITVLTVVSRVTFEGVEEQYNMPMEQWSSSMFIMQGAWVLIYSVPFSFIISLPFAFYFLGPKGDRG